MQKAEIIELINQKFDVFIKFLEAHPDQDFDKTKIVGKWTTGQHVSHLIKSMMLLNNALAIPKFILRLRFGKMNREERSYEGLKNRYKEKLKNMTVTYSGAAPDDVLISDKPILIKRLEKERQKLLKKITNYSESTLSSYIIPHPLLGKLSLREMMYFTAYHTEHHHHILQEHY